MVRYNIATVIWRPGPFHDLGRFVPASRCCYVVVAAGIRNCFGGYIVREPTRLQRIACASLTQIGALASSFFSVLASFSEPLGARRWRRLLCFCPRSLDRAQSRFHQGLPTRQRKFPRAAPRRK